MEITTERLILKPLGMEYYDTVCKYSMDIENARYMVWLPKNNIEEVETFLSAVDQEWKKEAPSYLEFAIIFDNIHIGAVSIYFDDSFVSGELGWIIDKRYWGRGYAYEASRAVVEKCRAAMGIGKFIAYCDSENYPSRRVMEKLGMHLVEQYGGRKNRASDEIREECLYEMNY